LRLFCFSRNRDADSIDEFDWREYHDLDWMAGGGGGRLYRPKNVLKNIKICFRLSRDRRIDRRFFALAKRDASFKINNGADDVAGLRLNSV
jgi:hypothetical protein